MFRPLMLRIGPVALAMLAWAWYSLGSVATWTGIIIVVFWIGFPLLAFAFLFALYRLRYDDGLHALRMTVWVAGTICLLLGARFLGEIFCKWEASKARSYVAQILPAIVSFHASERRYPDSLDELKLTSTVPRLFHYRKHGTSSFGLYYTDVSSMAGGWKYDLETKEWKNLDRD